MRADYDHDRRQIVVIADNCGDETGSVAVRAGAEAWTRQEPQRPGSGQAVAWALMPAGNRHDAVVTVDADCIASPNLLLALSSAIAAGADAARPRTWLPSRRPRLPPPALRRFCPHQLSAPPGEVEAWSLRRPSEAVPNARIVAGRGAHSWVRTDGASSNSRRVPGAEMAGIPHMPSRML
jgi:hypothetical protein